MKNTMLKLTLTTILVANLTACGGEGGSANTSSSTVTNSSNTTNTTQSTSSPYQGYWQSDDESKVLAIDVSNHQGETKEYQLNPVGCLLRNQYANSELSNQFGELNLSNDSEQINWQAQHSFEQRHFSRISALPTNCQASQLTQASDDPELNFNWIWHAINEHYAGFEVRDIDWQGIKQTIETQLNDNQSQNWQHFGKILDALEDPHAFLISLDHGVKQSIQLTPLHQKVANDNAINANNTNYHQIQNLTTARLEQAGQVIISQYLQNPQILASEQVIYGELKGSSAYINIRSMNLDGDDNLSNINKANEITAKLSQLLTNKTELIIDLRFNLGGNLPAAKIIADSLATIADTAYYMSFKQTDGYSNANSYKVEPSDQGFSGDIKILTSPLTGSAAEAFIYYLKAGHNNVELIGENTRGVQSAPIKHQLPNGWQVLIPARKITGPMGEYLENSGFSPDIMIESFSQQDINEQKDTVLESLQ